MRNENARIKKESDVFLVKVEEILHGLGVSEAHGGYSTFVERIISV